MAETDRARPRATVSCRICGAPGATRAGAVEYLAGCRSDVYDCSDCGCRFTAHDAAAHDALHATGAISYYRDYRGLADRCRALVGRGDRDGLRALLREVPKYRFVIDALDAAPAGARILEMGAACGHLAACFILEGRDIIGVDASREAITRARALFGEHFLMADDPEIDRRGPYDVVYHVGTIGCVADPLGFTRGLLDRLRPGGSLCFNAPNRAALRLDGQLWFDSAPPPDLVTLFPPGFWSRRFSSVADVKESVETIDPRQTLAASIDRLSGRRWAPPDPRPMDGEGHIWTQRRGAFARLLRRAAIRVGRSFPLASRLPAEFGIHVTMTRRETRS